MLDSALLWGRTPKVFLGLAFLYGAIDRKDSPLHPILRSLLTVRVSQLNGCSFCIDVNSATLLKRGVSQDKVAAIENWRQSNLFSEHERVALEYAEAVTLGSDAVDPALMTPETHLRDGPFIEDLRQQMVRFASLQLGDEHAAEDAVQEALVGALSNARSFGGGAALKTWVFAILKNKIADVLRQRRRSVDVGSLLQDDERDEDLSTLFDRKGFWRTAERPVAWGDPETALRQQQFWAVFEACLDALPPKQSRVFMMREFIELETAEICEATGMTLSNLFVLLHRARLRLRECLEDKWFSAGA